MTDIDHAPLPWDVIREGELDYAQLVDANKAPIQRNMANSEFIASAVNAHGPLAAASAKLGDAVKALRACDDFIRNMEDARAFKFRERVLKPLLTDNK